MIKEKSKKITSSLLLLSFFILYVIWWILTQYLHNDISYIFWGTSYFLFALYGALVGIYVGMKWGGSKSVLGRMMFAFSIGLLMQAIGQNLTNYQILTNTLSYPSFADIAYFLSVPCYIYGCILLTKVTGVESLLKRTSNRIFGISIVLFLSLISLSLIYYKIDYTIAHPLQFIIDSIYPLGEAIFISYVILNLILVRNLSGGYIRKPLFFLLLALVTQFLADYSFIILVGNDAWVAGGYNDLLYLSAYFLMAYAILEMYKVFLRKVE